MSQNRKRAPMAVAILLALGAPAGAVDGVIEINHARAVAGGVTPGDTPGYPVTIDRPGSYRLTGDLKVPGMDVDAVEVTANHVTLDLNGFSIFCPWITTPCAGRGTGHGINAETATSLTVRNGTVRDMPKDGINAGPRALVEDVRAEGNGQWGISIWSGVLRRDIAVGNDKGIGSHKSSPTIPSPAYLVLDCLITENSNYGIAGADRYSIGRTQIDDPLAVYFITDIACNIYNGVLVCPP